MLFSKLSSFTQDKEHLLPLSLLGSGNELDGENSGYCQVQPMRTMYFQRTISSVCLVCLALVLSQKTFAADPKTLQKEVSPHSILVKSMESPAWMKLWDRAREEVNAGDLEVADDSYRELLSQKPGIEEAQREYCINLMALQQWEEAGAVVQKLLEIDPSSQEYLLYGGRIDLIQHRYERASKYLGQVYSSAPDGIYALEALKGQIAALQKLGRLDMAYPLMEQLYLLIPHEEKTIRQLARYSVTLGNTAKALTYYKTLISEFTGIAGDFLASASLFEDAGDMDMAVICWQSYLKLHPSYLPFLVKLSDYLLAEGRNSEALSYLLARIAYGEEQPEIFIQIGKIYLYNKGRPDKALYYYEEYRKRRPNDLEVKAEILRIQAVLANDLLVIVENEGAWSLWRDLAKVIPDRLAVYYSMAEQLEKTNKRDELAEVLEIINFHNPGNQKILLRLAQLYFDKGLIDTAAASLDTIDPSGRKTKEYLWLRAGISEKKNEPLQTLAYYKAYLKIVPDDYAVILKALLLSGKIGLMPELNFFHDRLSVTKSDSSLFKKGSFLYGQALLENGLYSKAEDFYKELLKFPGITQKEKNRIEAGLLAGVQGEGDLFAAEEQIRIQLIQEQGTRQDILLLIKSSLLQKEWNDAWTWYSFLPKTPSNKKSIGRGLPDDNFFQKIEILQASGQLSVAIELLEEVFNDLDHPCVSQSEACFQARLELARLYYRVQRFDEARSVLATLSADGSNNDNVIVLNDLLKINGTQETILPSGLPGDDLPRVPLLTRARIYAELGEVDLALQICKRFLVAVPESLNAQILQASLLVRSSDTFGALKIFRELAARYPDECNFKENLIEMLFQSARFTELIELLAPQWKQVSGKEGALSVRQVVPDVKTQPIKQQLLLARSFWAVRRYEDALLLYRELLTPAVDQEYSKRLDAQGIVLSLPPPQKSLLNIITFTQPAEPERLVVVMSPEYTLQNLKFPQTKIAARLYASYRWQHLIKKELSVRQAMVDRNYYQAMKEYQNLLRNDYSSESLYDLAGVYSRLGFLGREAALYETMKIKTPGYPDLLEASQRNSIKREPRLTPQISFTKKEGRGGYYDIRQRGFGMSSWFMPSLKHELSVTVNRIYGESLENDTSQWRNHINAQLLWNPIYDLDFAFALGSERLDGGLGNSLLYDVQMNGRIGDTVLASFEVSQDIVDDTVQSVAESITQTRYEAGLTVDFLPRLFGGGEISYSEYSDGNHQNKYQLWTSYVISSEPTLLQLRYGYEYSKNAEGNLGQSVGVTGLYAADDYPYWSPREYWQHLLTLSFEHQLGDDILGRSAPSYYKLEYSFGYERGGYDNHQARGQIFLEMNRHFLLNSTVELTRGSEYEEAELFFSLIYRW